MAVFFQLYRIGSREPSRFVDIDNAICHNLDLPWDRTKYVCSWYDIIGFRLALGHSFQKITDDLLSDRQGQKDPLTEWQINILRINHFLLENYTPNAWWGR